MFSFMCAGWFQVRLASDPAPSDEPRGVSGYACAVAGEPNLDRIIRLQPPVVQRSYCPAVGVKLIAVYQDGKLTTGHPMLGADVELLDQPRFEGHNGIVAEAGFEPVVPFHFKMAKDGFLIQRTHQDDEEFPFAELKATGLNFSAAEIAEATGIWDLPTSWDERKAKLADDLKGTSDPTEKAALAKRIETLSNK